MEYFKLEPLDPEKLIKVNELMEVSNPVFFERNNYPTKDGLLSNEIFGITKDDRANTFAYIDLGGEVFLHPLFYKIWCKIDSKVKNIVHGTGTYIINDKGEFQEDENGENGIKFLKKNIDKINFRRTDSSKRDKNIQFLTEYKDYMFIKNMIVIPAYYRDVNSTAGGAVGVGEINKLYNSLIISVRSLRESSDYGLTLSNSVRGRVQETLLEIYAWFGQEPQLSKKRGIIRRAAMSKTTDYASRLVLSAPNLKVEGIDDLMVDMDHSAVPLASICANFYPFMIFNIRRFFETQFADGGLMNLITKSNDIEYQAFKVKDYQIQFSDDRIKSEMNNFMHGYSNRFKPVEVEAENGKMYRLKFVGKGITEEQLKNKVEPDETTPLIDRALTWCDVIYMAALESVKDKTILITRFPMDSYFNQFPSKIVVSSTKETEPMYYNGQFIKYYPKIRKEDIGTNTSNKFVDTLNICNAYLAAIGGDYDGDQVTVKGIYSDEANAELMNHMNSKAHYVNLGGENVRTSSNEAIQSLYNLTKVLDGTKLTDPTF